MMASLALSLAPLVAFALITAVLMLDRWQADRAMLMNEARADLQRLVDRQANVADALLDKIVVQTRATAFFAQTLLREASGSAPAPLSPPLESPEAQGGVVETVLPPELSSQDAAAELKRLGRLDQVFRLITDGEVDLEAVFYGARSGIYHGYRNRGRHEEDAGRTLALDVSLAPLLDKVGSVPAPVAKALAGLNVDLAPDARLETLAPGERWTITYPGGRLSLRREDAGIVVTAAYDPRERPWYLDASGGDAVTWTKYADWGGGDFLFTLGRGEIGQPGSSVSPELVRAFEKNRIALVPDAPITRTRENDWTLQDTNGNNFEIRWSKDDSTFRVYNVDILTASKAVRDPDGGLAGVVGLDVSMTSLRDQIIGNVSHANGDTFVLDSRGNVLDQERPDMFIPPAGSAIRARMIAQERGVETIDGGMFVAYAPIRKIASPDGMRSWSVGVSIPAADVTKLADHIQKTMLYMLAIMAGLAVLIMGIVVLVARRVSDGVTRPIEALGAGVARIGGGDLEYRLDIRTQDEIEALAHAFNRMAADLKTYVANLRATTAEKERIETELHLARRIQMKFLKLPPFPDRSGFTLHATIKPAREVGGDLYDFALLNDRLVFYIGDVADKGVPASLWMARTMTLMKRLGAEPDLTTAEILTEVNAVLAEDNEECMFVTLFVGVLDLVSGELAYSNAGHNPPLILGPDGTCEFLMMTPPNDLALAIDPDTRYRNATIHLEPGATILTYTDGVTEAMSADRRLYSDERLRETLSRLAGLDVEAIVAEIMGSVEGHAAGAPQSDDIAVLAVRRIVAPATIAAAEGPADADADAGGELVMAETG